MHTGDAGYFKDENKHLVVIDRMKDLAETSTGVRYSPQFIENKLKFSPFIAEAVILGKDLPFPVDHDLYPLFDHGEMG